MPAININLLDRKDLDKTALGSILRWSLTYGRYIIVCTEIIVLLAFIYRFSLDRKITDLSEEIDQKIAIIQANQVFENQFRNLQSRINQIDILSQNQNLSVEIVKHLEKITPTGVKFISYNFDGKIVTIDATSNTTVGLKVFLKNLKNSEYLTDINLTGLNKNNSDNGETRFQIQSTLKQINTTSQPT